MALKLGPRESLSVDKSLILGESRVSAAEKVASSAGGREPVPKPANVARQTLKASKESESDSVPDSLSVLSKRELIILLRLKQCHFDLGDLAALRQHTLSELRTWLRRARQRVCVQEASEFARWVMSSGLSKLLDGPGGSELERTRRDVLSECEEAWRREGAGAWVGKSDIDVLTAKLDRLTSVVADLVTAQGGHVQSPVTIFDGGLPGRASGQGGP